MATKTADEHRVVAAILCRGDRVPLCHRHPDRSWYPDGWDLPGGHVEDGELPRHALLREMHEELGIGITAPTEPIAHVVGLDFRTDIWLIDTWTGEPVNLVPEEYDELRWFNLDHASQLHLADPRMITLLSTVLK